MNLAETFSEAVRRLHAGDPGGAIPLLDELASATPSQPEVWRLGGLAAFALNRFADATHRFARARALEPDNPAHAINLANALIKLDGDVEAARELAAALKLDPRSADAEIALGTLARRAGRLDDAVRHADRALTFRPTSYPAWVNRGRALHELGQFDDAIQSYEKAIAIDSQAGPAHAQMALSLLIKGDFERGWPEYEWRGEGSDLVSRSRFAEPEWRGENLGGMPLLVHAEQGYGDTIQFARFLSLAEAKGIRIILEVQPALRRLFAGFAPSITVIARGDPLPPFSRQIRLMSLPKVLGVRIDSIPPPVTFPQERPSGAARHLTVGLSWAGSRAHENDRNRSIASALLEPLGEIAGIRFVSVQKDPQGPVPSFAFDRGSGLEDFAGLKSVLQELDLLIAIDSAPAHLMGSLGRPVWVMLPDPPDWRWLLGCEDSPWYPTARLFRQRRRGDWREVIGRVCAALQGLRDEKAGAA